jgi:hypothetical protein
VVQKRGGVDSNVLYVMKIVEKDIIIKEDVSTCVMRERAVLEEVTGSPFLVGLKYAFQTQSELHFIMGEYIKAVCMAVRGSQLNVQGPYWAAGIVLLTSLCVEIPDSF